MSILLSVHSFVRNKDSGFLKEQGDCKEVQKNAQGPKNRLQVGLEEIRQQSVNYQGSGAGSDFPCRVRNALFSLLPFLTSFPPVPSVFESHPALGMEDRVENKPKTLII